MAYYSVSAKEKWIGWSTDIKPSAIYNGSEFYEMDTGQNWIWYDGNWVEDLRYIKAISDALL